MLLIIQIIKKYNIISNLDISNNFKSICLGRERPWQSSSWPSCPPGVMLRIMKLTKFVNKTVQEIPVHLFVLILVDRGVLADRVLAVLHLFHLEQEGAKTTFHLRCSFPRKWDRQTVIERRQPPLVYRKGYRHQMGRK